MAANDFNDPIYFGIKKEAVQAYNKLRDAQEKYKNWNCKDNPDKYMDYDTRGLEDGNLDGEDTAPTIEEAEALCFGCPLLKQCYDFALANEEAYGIWGGIDFGAVQDEDKLF